MYTMEARDGTGLVAPQNLICYNNNKNNNNNNNNINLN